MKKCLLFLIVQVFAIQAMFAADLTPAQIKLRNEIQTFLKEEGFMPELDPDGDIHFKKEGSTYYVKVSSTDESPMFVVLYKSFKYPSEYSHDVLKMASVELNLYKGVKIICFESAFRIQCDMYLASAESFKDAFYTLMVRIKNVQDNILNECAKVESLGGQVSSTLLSRVPFLITSMEIANTGGNGEILQNYGSTLFGYQSKYLKPQLTISPLETAGAYTVYVKFYKNGVLSAASSSPSGYSYSDTVTLSGASSSTVTLSGWGSDTAGHWPAGQYKFEVWYGDYCLGSKAFTVY